MAGIYRQRGLPEQLVQQVAQALHDADPPAATNSDTPTSPPRARYRPAAASAASFFVGGLLPLLGLLAPTARLWLIVGVTLIGLVVTGILSAWIAGTALTRPAQQVVIGGGLAMAITAVVGQLVHVSGI